MTQKSRKQVRSAQEKLDIVKSHLLGGMSVSAVCEEHNIAPSVFYKWQAALFENGAQALERKNGRGSDLKRESRELTDLRVKLKKSQDKLSEKHEVLSELMSEHIKLKKSIGD
jgi:transposase-like protein